MQDSNNYRPGRAILAALIFGVLAAVLAGLWLKQREAELRERYAPKPVTKVDVVVPTRHVSAGEVVSLENMAARSVPVDYVPDSVVLASDFEAVEGRLIVKDLLQGKMVGWSAVLGERDTDFSDQISVGQRAKTIRVSQVNSFDGMLRPGNRIDILGTFDAQDTPFADAEEENPGKMLFPVMENVLVVATGQRSSQSEGSDEDALRLGVSAGYSTITVEVTPLQAARLTMAEDLGQLTAVLRNRDDISSANFSLLQVEEIFQKSINENVELVYDKNGNLIGRRLGSTVVDEAGNIVANIRGDKIVGLDGTTMGDYFLISSGQGDSELVLAKDGTVIGTRRGGVVYDSKGNAVAQIVGDRVVANDGTVLNDKLETRTLSARGKQSEYVLNDKGEVMGIRVGNQILKEDGSVAGYVRDGEVYDASGNKVASSVRTSKEGRKRTTESQYVEFIGGGQSSGGVAEVKKLVINAAGATQ